MISADIMKIIVRIAGKQDGMSKAVKKENGTYMI
jgi:hypothetical protein